MQKLTTEQLQELRYLGADSGRQDIVDAAKFAIYRGTDHDHAVAAELYAKHCQDHDAELFSSPELTERDRLMVYEVVRRYLAADITRRGIADTYTPGALTISAYDLHEFVNDLLRTCSGDAVDLAKQVAADIADVFATTDPEPDSGSDIACYLPELPELVVLENAHPDDVAAERANYE